MDKKGKKGMAFIMAIGGIAFITSGLIMSTSNRTIIEKKYNLEVTEKKVNEAKTNEIKLKEIVLEINTPLSVDIKDYLQNANELSSSTLKQLKLDTSMININEAGKYTYTISYNKKKYNGICTIKAKELPKQVITLKELRLAKGSALSTNLTSYIKEELIDEVKNNITLDLSKVNTAQPGEYLYTVTYDSNVYTAKIIVYEPQTTIITPNEDKKEEKDKDKPSPSVEPSPSPSPSPSADTQTETNQ